MEAPAQVRLLLGQALQLPLAQASGQAPVAPVLAQAAGVAHLARRRDQERAASGESRLASGEHLCLQGTPHHHRRLRPIACVPKASVPQNRCPPRRRQRHHCCPPRLHPQRPLRRPQLHHLRLPLRVHLQRLQDQQLWAWPLQPCPLEPLLVCAFCLLSQACHREMTDGISPCICPSTSHAVPSDLTQATFERRPRHLPPQQGPSRWPLRPWKSCERMEASPQATL